MLRSEGEAMPEELTGEGVISVSPPPLVKTHMQFKNNMAAVAKRSNSRNHTQEQIPTR